MIISSFLMQQFGWQAADPICSMFISVLIFMSVIPLLRGSFRVLMQQVPPAMEPEVLGALDEVCCWGACSGRGLGQRWAVVVWR